MRASLAILAVVVGLAWALPALAADAPSATPDELATLQEILARPEFQAGQGRALLDRLLDPIRAWVRSLWRQLLQWLDRLSRSSSGGNGDTVLLWIVGTGLLIVLAAAFLLHRLARGSVAEDAALATATATRRARAAEELARARELAQAGQARRALHHHYRAVLLRLDERDHLPLNVALTNRELLPRLTAAPELAGPFGELVARFDRLWYGQAECSPDEYAAFARLADRVWQGAGAS